MRRTVPASDTRDTIIGRVAVLVTVTTVVVVTVTVIALALPAFFERFRDQPTPAYAVGDLIDLNPALYRSSHRTVFMFSRFSCSACQASQRVMADIVADVAKHPDARVVLVVADSSPDEERSFAGKLGLEPSQIHQTDLRTLRVRQVPTMVLADRAGRILMAREGLLTESDRIDVVRLSTAQVQQRP